MPPKKPEESESAAAEEAAGRAAAKERDDLRQQLGLKLRDAVRQGDVDQARHLVRENKLCDVNFTDSQGWSALHYACRNGDNLLADWLIRSGAHVTKVDHSGLTSLMYACRNGHLCAAELLVTSGANVHFCDPADSTPLHFATRWGHRDVVQFLLEAQADVRAADEEGKTPLHIAAEARNGEADHQIIRDLLKCGADTQKTLDNCGFSAEDCCSSPFLRTLMQYTVPGTDKAQLKCKREATAVFNVLDTNSDGYLDVAELSVGLGDVGCTEAEVNKMLDRIGAKAGKATRAQFRELFPEYRDYLFKWLELKGHNI